MFDVNGQITYIEGKAHYHGFQVLTTRREGHVS